MKEFKAEVIVGALTIFFAMLAMVCIKWHLGEGGEAFKWASTAAAGGFTALIGMVNRTRPSGNGTVTTTSMSSTTEKEHS